MALYPGLAVVESRLQIVCHHRETGVLVRAVAGEIDLMTAPVLRRGLSRAGYVSAPIMVLDLSRVDFLGAIGVDIEVI